MVQLIDDLPSRNQKIVAKDFLVAAGGPATNAAVAFAHCGGSPLLVTALPRHSLTEIITADLVQAGVDVVQAASYDGPPVTASILVDAATGERAVVSPTGVASDADLADDATLPDVDGAGVVLVDGYFRSLALPLMRRAREAGIPVVMDGGSVKPHTREVLAEVDAAIVSGDFAPPGTDGEPEAVFAWLADAGVGWAAITRGERPILFRTPAGAGEVPVAPVTVRDTLGAGDFFHGAVAARIAADGLDAALFPDQLEWASRVAGASLASFGTREWLRSPLF